LDAESLEGVNGAVGLIAAMNSPDTEET